MTDPFVFVLQTDSPDVGELAAQAEAAGVDAIGVADHPGSTWSPFVVLASAVERTERLLLATAVVNCGVREPLDIASDAATLQSLSGGRVVLGLGAGHTPQEWSQIGRSRPSPSDRIDRFDEVLRSTVALLQGESVTVNGRHITLHDARLQMELPPPPSLLVGGGNRRLVRLGCELADIVELSGIGRTLPDGHYHEPRWATTQVDAAVKTFEQDCAAAGRRPVLGALVQHISVTDDAEKSAQSYIDAAAAVIPAELLPTVADVLECPYCLVGTAHEIATKLTRLRDRWGFSRYTVRSLKPLIGVIAALN